MQLHIKVQVRIEYLKSQSWFFTMAWIINAVGNKIAGNWEELKFLTAGESFKKHLIH